MKQGSTIRRARTSERLIGRALLAIVAMFSATSAFGQAMGASPPSSTDGKQNSRPSVLQNVGVDQKLSAQAPLDLKFKDEFGKDVRLGAYFNGKRPVLLALVYYNCPMLCNQVLIGMTSALSILKFNAGQEFEVLAVSFDPHDTPESAAGKKKYILNRYLRPGTEQGWHFLTGKEESIAALTKTVGFRYQWDEKTKQFAHGSALILMTPEGKVAQYYYGIEYSPKDIRLGMIEASQEKIGNLADEVILLCYHYDPTTGKYGAITINLVRLGGILTVLALGAFIGISLRRDSRSGGNYNGPLNTGRAN